MGPVLKKMSVFPWSNALFSPAEWQGERDRDRAQAQAKLKEALAEKEQVSQELSALEISFSELFKRLEKYKGVLEGYKKVSTPRAPACPQPVFPQKGGTPC